eukprot:scaffold43090_cov67-Phaeocystis_antarctica.AAC.5
MQRSGRGQECREARRRLWCGVRGWAAGGRSSRCVRSLTMIGTAQDGVQEGGLRAVRNKVRSAIRTARRAGGGPGCGSGLCRAVDGLSAGLGYGSRVREGSEPRHVRERSENERVENSECRTHNPALSAVALPVA